jgi:hypothetical protein
MLGGGIGTNNNVNAGGFHLLPLEGGVCDIAAIQNP